MMLMDRSLKYILKEKVLQHQTGVKDFGTYKQTQRLLGGCSALNFFDFLPDFSFNFCRQFGVVE
jgi:hypothetical protein